MHVKDRRSKGEPVEPLPQKLVELLDEIDAEMRSLAVTRVLNQRGVNPELPTLVVRGLRQLLDGERYEAARVFEVAVEEILERTVSMDEGR